MAKAQTNPVIQNLIGKLKRAFMFRRLRDRRCVLCRKPDFSRRAYSDEQLNHQHRFKAAAIYAKAAAKIQPIYTEIARGTLKNALNVALSDWFHPPEILACDFENWRGQAGDIVRIQAVDDVLVVSMQAVFRDDGAAELLVGVCKPNPSFGAAELIVLVEDLAGNVVEQA